MSDRQSPASGTLEIRSTGPEEYPLMLQLLKEAALWLQNRGSRQWSLWLDPPPGFCEWVRTSFARGEGRFVWLDEALVGGFRLQWEDELFWGPQSLPAGYIHSLTVRRRYQGHRLGSRILKRIETLCLEAGREYLRLDYDVTYPFLGKYYRDHGFEPVGTTQVDTYHLVLMEKKLTPQGPGS